MRPVLSTAQSTLQVGIRGIPVSYKPDTPLA